MAQVRTLYPKIEPYMTDFLKVSDIHSLYFEQSGNPEGKPVVVLHGGKESLVYNHLTNTRTWRRM